MRHPTGIGTWRVWLRSHPLRQVVVPGHTATEAFYAARPLLVQSGGRCDLSFADCEFDLLSDEPPEPKAEKPAGKKKIRRLVGAERGA